MPPTKPRLIVRPDDYRAIYLRVIAAVQEGNFKALDDLLADDLVDHNPIPGQSPGREGFKEWMASARQTFPDLSATVEDTVVENDRLAGRVTFRGTHSGSLAGVRGTNLPVEFTAFHIVRFSQGKIVEWWGTANLLDALLQVGARIIGPS
jgi:predicted ester cyclase